MLVTIVYHRRFEIREGQLLLLRHGQTLVPVSQTHGVLGLGHGLGVGSWDDRRRRRLLLDIVERQRGRRQ